MLENHEGLEALPGHFGWHAEDGRAAEDGGPESLVHRFDVPEQNEHNEEAVGA